MAQDEEFEGEEGDQPEFEGGGGAGANRKRLLMIVVPVVLVLGGAVGAYFTGLADPLLAMFGGGEAPAEEVATAEHAAEPPAGEHAATPAAEGAKAVMYAMPEMLVNINTAGRAKNFLKIKVTLELSNEADIARIEDVLPRITDNFQVYLRELRLEDLQGAAGMYRLREELLSRVNAAVRPSQVKDVLFQEMIVQ